MIEFFFFGWALLKFGCFAVGAGAFVCVLIALCTEHPASATGVMKDGQRW